MLHQHVFHFVRAHSETACFNNIIKAAVEPIASVFIHICRISRVIYAVAPDIAVLVLIVQICGKYTGLPAGFFGDDDDFADLADGSRLSILCAKLDVVEGGGRSHGTFHSVVSFEICRQQGCLSLAVSLAQLKPGTFSELAEYFGRQHLTCGRSVFERRHVGNSLAYKIAVNRRGSTE